MIGYLVAAAGLEGAVLGVLVWWYRRKASAATAACDRAVADLTAAQQAAAQERTRLQGASNAGDAFFDVYQIAVEAMVTRHPELAGEYRQLVLAIAAGTAGAAHAAVPGAATADPAPRGVGGGAN